MKVKEFKELALDQVIRLTFYDHCKSSRDLIVCEAFGKVVDVSSKKVVLLTWDLRGEDEETRANNEEVIAIAASTVIAVTVYSVAATFA